MLELRPNCERCDKNPPLEALLGKFPPSTKRVLKKATT
jgi:hypothetical protein